MCERVGRLRAVAIVGLLEGRAIVLGRRGPRITTCIVGYGRRIVHSRCSRSGWSLEMQVVDGAHLLETMTSHLPRTGTCQEPRAANLSISKLVPVDFSTNLLRVIFCFCCRSLICLLSDNCSVMLLRSQWPCRRLHHNAKSLASITARSFASSTPRRNDLATTKTRNIGIIAHIDAVRRNMDFFGM